MLSAIVKSISHHFPPLIIFNEFGFHGRWPGNTGTNTALYEEVLLGVSNWPTSPRITCRITRDLEPAKVGRSKFTGESSLTASPRSKGNSLKG